MRFIRSLWRLNCGSLHNPPRGILRSTFLFLCNSVDDSFLQRTVSSIPKQAIFLIEDIDCAFPSREELDEMEEMPYFSYPGRTKSGRPMSQVTLSGLLNVLDGVGSDEGKIFFATVCPCSLVFDSDVLDKIWELNRQTISKTWILPSFDLVALTARFNITSRPKRKPKLCSSSSTPLPTPPSIPNLLLTPMLSLKKARLL